MKKYQDYSNLSEEEVDIFAKDVLTYAKDQTGCRILQAQIDKGNTEFIT